MKEEHSTQPEMVGPDDSVGFEGPVDISSVTIRPIPDQPWMGEPICPELSLSYEGEPLTEGFDYTVAYADNDGPGIATAVVQGQWHFTGECEVHYVITGQESDNGEPGGSGCLPIVVGVIASALLFSFSTLAFGSIPVFGLIWGIIGWIPCFVLGFGIVGWLTERFS